MKKRKQQKNEFLNIAKIGCLKILKFHWMGYLSLSMGITLVILQNLLHKKNMVLVR